MPTEIFYPQGEQDTVIIIGPGPSLTKDQCDKALLSGAFIIAIGDAYLLSPYADILYHCDAQWWKAHKGVPDFQGCQRVSLEETDIPSVQRVLQTTQRVGLSSESPKVVSGGNSLYQAINLACHYKPKNIILIGCDLKKSSTGKYNVRGDHIPGIKGRAKFPKFIERLSTLVKPLEQLGITVYNCSIDTALNCFPREELINVLPSKG